MGTQTPAGYNRHPARVIPGLRVKGQRAERGMCGRHDQVNGRLGSLVHPMMFRNVLWGLWGLDSLCDLTSMTLTFSGVEPQIYGK